MSFLDKPAPQIYDIILRKNNDRESAVVEKGTLEHCLSYVKIIYPNFKQDTSKPNYFYKTRGRGLNGEIFIKLSE